MGQKSFAIRTIFKIIDRISGPIKKATKSVRRFKRVMQRSMRAARASVLSLASSIKSKLLTSLKGLAVGFGAVLALGVGLAVREFVNFDQALTNASAKFNDLAGKPKETALALIDLGKAARKVGAETQFTATQAAEGLDFLARASFNSKQAIAALPQIIDLATASTIDFATAADIASDTLGIFGLLSKDTAILQKNLGKTSDIMARATTSANLDMNQLFETIKGGGSIFNAAGQKLSTFVALTKALADKGVKGQKAGIALRNMITSIAKPTAEAATLIEKLGIRTADSKGNFLNMIDIMGQFEKATEKMGNKQKAATGKILFGKVGITAFTSLIAVGSDKLKKYEKDLINSGGAAKAMADQIRKGLGARLQILGSSLVEVGFKFIEAFAKQGGGALDKLTKLVQEFDPKPITDGIITTAKAAKRLFDIVEPFAPIIIGMVTAFVAYKTALMAVVIAQWALNAATIANPIGLIVVAVGALIGGLFILVKNWDLVTAAVNNFIDTAVARFPILKTLWDLSLPGLIINNWEDISLFFQGLWEILKIVWSNIFVGIKKAWDMSIPGLIIANWDKVVSFFEDMDSKIGGPLGTVLSIAKTVASALLTSWQPVIFLFENLFSLMGKVVSGIGSIGLKGIRFIQSFAGGKKEEGAGEEGGTSPITPIETSQSITNQSFTDNVSRSEISLIDQTGKASVTGGQLPPGVTLAQSGAF